MNMQRLFMISSLSLLLLLSACGGDESNDSDNVSTDFTLVSEYSLEEGRLLASQCFQCHGTNGNSNNEWDSIAGESAYEIIEEMEEFQSGEEDEPIMEAQAHGYSYSEITVLAGWLATQ
jgi:cytochrome c553